jgi:hypothetical protein
MIAVFFIGQNYEILLSFRFLFVFCFRCSAALSPRLPITFWRLGAGGASTAARTGAKLENSHKFSGELLPRLRQTAR